MTTRQQRQRPRRVCPRCAGEEAHVVREDETAKSKDGVEVSYIDEFSRCATCEHEFYTKAQSLAHSRAIAAAIRSREGLYTPAQIAAIRQSLHLTQTQLERAMGLGAKTVVRWERGTVTQSRAANSLLWIADNYRPVFLALAMQNGVQAQQPVCANDAVDLHVTATASTASGHVLSLSPDEVSVYEPCSELGPVQRAVDWSALLPEAVS